MQYAFADRLSVDRKRNGFAHFCIGDHFYVRQEIISADQLVAVNLIFQLRIVRIHRVQRIFQTDKIDIAFLIFEHLRIRIGNEFIADFIEERGASVILREFRHFRTDIGRIAVQLKRSRSDERFRTPGIAGFFACVRRIDRRVRRRKRCEKRRIDARQRDRKMRVVDHFDARQFGCGAALQFAVSDDRFEKARHALFFYDALERIFYVSACQHLTVVKSYARFDRKRIRQRFRREGRHRLCKNGSDGAVFARYEKGFRDIVGEAHDIGIRV